MGRANHYNPNANSRFTDVSLYKGDVVWMILSQTLSHVSKAGLQAEKPRPFVVLQDTTYRADFNQVCQSHVSLLGVTGTSQEILTQGRPHISFSIASDPQYRTTYVHTDTLTSIQCYDKQIRRRHSLTKAQVDDLDKDLSKVLIPEKKFFFKELVGKKCLPGQVWHIETASHSGLALVLLKRGSFTLNETFNAQGEIIYKNGPSAKTPYLVLFFEKGLQSPTLQGMQWNDVTVMAVHEGAFIRKEMEMNPKTAGNVLNALRGQIGLPPIIFEQYNISDLSTFFTNPFRFLSPRGAMLS